MSVSMDLREVVGSQVCGNGVWHTELLPATNDGHGGVIVEMKEHMDSETFVIVLRASMLQWKQQEGFRYHHAEPSYLMLVSWIPNTPNNIPANVTHRVRVGAIILNDKREVLTVQEKSGRFRGTGIWKIPTGVVDEGEDIFMGAIREVREETGVDTEFVEKQELEIEAVQWMPFEEYAAQPFAQKHELFKYINELCLAKVDRDYAGFSPRPTLSMFSDQPSYLYLNNKDLDKSSSANNSCINVKLG